MSTAGLLGRSAQFRYQRDVDLIEVQRPVCLLSQQTERGAYVAIPLSARSQRLLKRYAGEMTLLIYGGTGKAYDPYLFDKKFALVREKAKLPKELQFRDFRKTAVVHMGRGGAKPTWIASVTGHSYETVMKLLETYLPRDGEMAASGIASLQAYRQGTKLEK